MIKRERTLRQRLAALALLGAVLLNFPVLGLPAGEWFGLPALFVYIFAVWLGLIAVAAWLLERAPD